MPSNDDQTIAPTCGRSLNWLRSTIVLPWIHTTIFLWYLAASGAIESLINSACMRGSATVVRSVPSPPSLVVWPTTTTMLSAWEIRYSAVAASFTGSHGSLEHSEVVIAVPALLSTSGNAAKWSDRNGVAEPAVTAEADDAVARRQRLLERGLALRGPGVGARLEGVEAADVPQRDGLARPGARERERPVVLEQNGRLEGGLMGDRTMRGRGQLDVGVAGRGQRVGVAVVRNRADRVELARLEASGEDADQGDVEIGLGDQTLVLRGGQSGGSRGSRSRSSPDRCRP